MSELFTTLTLDADTKVVLVVLDGLGGYRSPDRPSELTAAQTPNLDSLAKEGSTGLHTVVGPGITPGSGAGHLALFGYDPVTYQLGRGALSGAGIGFELKPGDVAARVNFCTIDEAGAVTDRRAGRIPTDVNAALAAKIRSEVKVPDGYELFVEPEKDHRALLVLRGPGLSPLVADTDPQLTGIAPHVPQALAPEAARTAELLEDVLAQIKHVLAGERANFMLLRGFDTLRKLTSFKERYKLNAMGIAGYPMYIGIARILGMHVHPPVASFTDGVDAMKSEWGSHDFFYIHLKATDAAGEDGDFDRKVAAIEEVDALIPRIMDLAPDVICVTGDHATPHQMKAHSWHPVPFLMHGDLVGIDTSSRFDEEACSTGGFGRVMGKDLMPLMLAAAGRLAKYGA